MVSYIGATERKAVNKEKLNYSMQKLTNLGQEKKHNTHSLTHDGQIMQGFADGHIVVTGHDNQE